MKLIDLEEHVKIGVFGTPMNPKRVDDYVFAYVVPPMDYADPRDTAFLFNAPPGVSYMKAVQAFREFERQDRIYIGKAMVTNQYYIDNHGVPSKRQVLDTN